MRQGWPFETTIRAPVGADLQGLPLGPALAWESLVPWPLPQTTQGTCLKPTWASYRAQVGMNECEHRHAVLLCC